MLDITAGAKPPAPKSITIKHLANELAEQHQFTKQQGFELVEELIGMIATHLKKGERVRSSDSKFCKCASVLPVWAAIRRLANQSASRPARRSPSALLRNSRRRSDR